MKRTTALAAVTLAALGGFAVPAHAGTTVTGSNDNNASGDGFDGYVASGDTYTVSDPSATFNHNTDSGLLALGAPGFIDTTVNIHAGDFSSNGSAGISSGSSTINISGGSFTHNGNSSNFGNSGGVLAVGGDVHVTGGSFTDNQYGDGVGLDAATGTFAGGTYSGNTYGLFVYNGSAATVTGGSYGGNHFDINVDGQSSLAFSGGTLGPHTSGFTAASGLGLYNFSTADITGGTITSLSTAISAYSNSILDISGGSIGGNYYDLIVSRSTANITGGTFTGSGTSKYAFVNGVYTFLGYSGPGAYFDVTQGGLVNLYGTFTDANGNPLTGDLVDPTKSFANGLFYGTLQSGGGRQAFRYVSYQGGRVRLLAPQVVATPEPATFVGLGAGFALLGLRLARRRARI